MNKKNVLSILVENSYGVLSRVTGLFSRRGYSIDSLSVGETEDSNFSRITITVHCDDAIMEQIKKQVEKLENTVRVTELTQESSVYRELLLIKVKAIPAKRAEIVGLADIFRAKIIDVSAEAAIIELTGETSKINAFVSLVEEYGILELARTGLTALSRS